MEDKDEKIMQYVHLRMSAEEKAAFEQQIAQDAELKNEVDFWLKTVLAHKIFGEGGAKEHIEKAVLKIASEQRRKQKQLVWLKRIAFALAACLVLVFGLYYLTVFLPAEKKQILAQETLKSQKPILYFEQTGELVPQETQGFGGTEERKKLPLREWLLSSSDSLAKVQTEQAGFGFHYAYYLFERGKIVESKQIWEQMTENPNPVLQNYSRYYLALLYLSQKEQPEKALNYLQQVAAQDDSPALQREAEAVLKKISLF